MTSTQNEDILDELDDLFEKINQIVADHESVDLDFYLKQSNYSLRKAKGAIEAMIAKAERRGYDRCLKLALECAPKKKLLGPTQGNKLVADAEEEYFIIGTAGSGPTSALKGLFDAGYDKAQNDIHERLVVLNATKGQPHADHHLARGDTDS